MKDYKLDIETSTLEFERWCDAMMIEYDESEISEDGLASFNRYKKILLKAIRLGHLVISDFDEAVYTPFRPNSGHTSPITFKERKGSTLLATDKRKESESAARMYVALADMTGEHPNTFSKLSGMDITVCEAIFVLLMA
jgi:hypothetical protein